MSYRALGIEPIGLPRAAPATAATGDGRYFLFGLSQQGTNTMVLVDPELLTREHRIIEVGVAGVAVPGDTQVGDWTTDSSSAYDRVFVDLVAPTGAGQISSSEPHGPVTTTPTARQHDAAGRTWTAHATTTDTVVIGCQSPSTAEHLVQNTTVPGVRP
ncbi:MAG: hypothetical protein JOZ99_06180 [Actinobacteria bacterium]|nr:hypothetical protein [Actinomycetota bacterium]